MAERDYSLTAADNDDADTGINLNGTTASIRTADDTMRTIMQRRAIALADTNGSRATTGSSNTYAYASAGSAATPSNPFTAYVDGNILLIEANHSNTGAATLNVDSVGAKAIRRQDDTALQSGDMISGGKYLLVYDATFNSAAGAWVLLNPEATGSPAGYIYGLTISNNSTDATNDIDIATGSCRDSTDAINMTLASALTKRLDAGWSAGTGNGMRNSAASITDTTYHIYVVAKAGGADADIYAHTSATVATVITALQAETGGSNYVYARRIGSIVRASSAILAFKQRGNRFTLNVRDATIQDMNPGTSAVTKTLPSLPTGIVVRALLTAGMVDSSPAADSAMLLTPLNIADTTPTATTSQVRYRATTGGTAEAATEVEIETNTSAQIRYRISVSNADIFVRISVNGWVDRRGQDA